LHRSDSTATAEDELKYLSELDLERQQQRYALARILIWATPMLGFLGTVLGISEALGGIAIGPENNFESMMNGLRGSLYVAFDTTALALTLSMFLMFVLFLIDRFEMQLLSLVDTRTHAEVSRHFDLAAPENSALQSFSNEFLAASKQAVRDQTKIWAHSIHSAEQAWASTLSQTNDHVQENLTEALSQNFKVLSDELSASIDKADNAMAHRWQQCQPLGRRQLQRTATQSRTRSKQTGDRGFRKATRIARDAGAINSSSSKRNHRTPRCNTHPANPSIRGPPSIRGIPTSAGAPTGRRFRHQICCGGIAFGNRTSQPTAKPTTISIGCLDVRLRFAGRASRHCQPNARTGVRTTEIRSQFLRHDSA
jgi:biopolymer transport protein ExbB/TolQ